MSFNPALVPVTVKHWFGLDTKTSRAAMPLGFSASVDDFHDIDLSVPGVAKTRGGLSTLVNLTAETVRRIYDWYVPSTDTHWIAAATDTKAYKVTSAGVKTQIDSGFTSGYVLDFLGFKSRLFFGNGNDNNRQYNGTTAYNWGITKPSVVPTVALVGGGALTGTYLYRYTYVNTTSGHESTASGASASTSPAGQNVDVSYTASAETGVDKINIYRTTNGGSIYFYVTQVNNATSTYTDSTADAALGTTQAPLHNNPPPKFAGIEEWDGRIWGFKLNDTKVYFSNDEFWTPAGNGNPEEAYHENNFIDFKLKVFGVKKSPNLGELWVHTSGGIYAAVSTFNDLDPYRPVLRCNNWASQNHFTIANVVNEQWFQSIEGKVMGVDSAGNVNYPSYRIEPTITGGNVIKYVNHQACQYRSGGKNQYRLLHTLSGAVTPNRLFAANYLMRTPTDERGYSCPVWEFHTISATAIGVVKNASNQEILYVGDTSGNIINADTGTADNGAAISWSHNLAWVPALLSSAGRTSVLRKILHYYNPLGSWSWTLRTDFDFGASGGQTYSVSAPPSGAVFDTAVFDTDVWAGSSPLIPVTRDLAGPYQYVSLTWYGNTLNQTMEQHTVYLMPFMVEGFRDKS